MPILVQCIKCLRKMRVRDRLRDKMIKCPDCETAFIAHPIDELPEQENAKSAYPAESSTLSSAETPLFKAMSVVAAILLSAGLVGLGIGCWVSSAIDR